MKYALLTQSKLNKHIHKDFTVRILLITAALALLPISELRGAIPFALGNKEPILFTYIYCVLLNASVGPLVFIFLNTLHKFLIRFKWYAQVFNSFVAKNRHKIERKIRKYGYLGLALFVAIPLPVTGAYTGTLGAWLMGLEPHKTFLSVLIGVSISGIIVTAISYFGIAAFSIFTKQIML